MNANETSFLWSVSMDTKTPRVYNFALPTVYEKFYLNKMFFFIIKYILKETMTLNALLNLIYYIGSIVSFKC